jgi:S1-C subfamily serine protease
MRKSLTLVSALLALATGCTQTPHSNAAATAPATQPAKIVAAVPATQPADPVLGELRQDQQKTLAVADHLIAATVDVANTKMGGFGSGVVVSEDGLVLTAAHVIGENGSSLMIMFPDGRRARAKALGADRTKDAGMCKIIDPGPWPFVKMGHSASLKQGDWCLATGHPGGPQHGRTPPLRLGRILADGKGTNLADGITTDATVISGDSGGPLFDLDGNVIGIHSNVGADVMQNRHVPIDVFHDQWDQLLAGRQVGHGQEHIAGGRGMPGMPGMPNMRDLQAKAGRFTQLLMQHVQAGDPDALALLHGGRVQITPEDMDRLLAKWDKPATTQPTTRPATAVAGATTRPSSSVASTQPATRPNGLAAAPNLFPRPYGVPRYRMGFGPRHSAAEMAESKASPNLFTALKPLAADPGTSVVTVLANGKTVALGTVVRHDGCILTKAGELTGEISCRIGAQTLPAKIVAKDEQYDLALLQVSAELTPIHWAAASSPSIGRWIFSPGAEGRPLALGVVGVATRSIPSAPMVTMLQNRAVMGIQLDPEAPTARLLDVMPNGAAARAGLKAGDIITAVNGHATATGEAVRSQLGAYKPGDAVMVDIKRAAQPQTIRVVLDDAEKAPGIRGDNPTIDRLSEMGGTVSHRKGNFPQAFTHDSVIQAAQCGGPVVDLAGNVVGLNIARADRTATYAIPSGAIQPRIDALLKSLTAK